MGTGWVDGLPVPTPQRFPTNQVIFEAHRTRQIAQPSFYKKHFSFKLSRRDFLTPPPPPTLITVLTLPPRLMKVYDSIKPIRKQFTEHLMFWVELSNILSALLQSLEPVSNSLTTTFPLYGTNSIKIVTLAFYDVRNVSFIGYSKTRIGFCVKMVLNDIDSSLKCSFSCILKGCIQFIYILFGFKSIKHKQIFLQGKIKILKPLQFL